MRRRMGFAGKLRLALDEAHQLEASGCTLVLKKRPGRPGSRVTLYPRGRCGLPDILAAESRLWDRRVAFDTGYNVDYGGRDWFLDAFTPEGRITGALGWP